MTVPPGSPPPPGYQPPPGHQPAAMVVPAFFVKQRITLMINRYEVLAANPDGTEGQLMALAEQKRMKLKEEVIFYSDESKSRRVFSFKARQRLDVGAQHDVYDEYGNAARHVQQAVRRQPAALDLEPVGAGAGGRRSGAAPGHRDPAPDLGLPPRASATSGCPSSSTSTSPTTRPGAVVLVSERQKAIRDRYTVTVPDPRIDFRVAASMAVALDALQSR